MTDVSTLTSKELADKIRQSQELISSCIRELMVRGWRVMCWPKNDDDYRERDRSYRPEMPYVYKIVKPEVIQEAESI